MATEFVCADKAGMLQRCTHGSECPDPHRLELRLAPTPAQAAEEKIVDIDRQIDLIDEQISDLKAKVRAFERIAKAMAELLPVFMASVGSDDGGRCRHDTTEFNKNLELAEGLVSSLGPAGESALAKTIETIKSNREAIADPQMFFAALDHALHKQLTKHGAAIPPEGFDKVEQALDDQIDKIKQDIDSMSEMGETESLRLQMAMDRMSKMMSTLSNVMKKMSDTASQITQNLK